MLFRSLLSLAFRHMFGLVSSVVIGLAVAAAYAHSLPPTYTSKATLLLEAGRSAASGQEFSSAQGLDTNRADSELQAIRSERLLSSVFESLRLNESPELGMKHPGVLMQMLTKMRNLIFGNADSAPDRRDPSMGYLSDAARAHQQAFLNFTERLHANRVAQSFVITVEYSSSDPSMPARVANAVVSGYILEAVSFKEQMARAGTEVLQGRLDSLAAQVEAARTAMREGSLPAIATPDADARIIGAALPPLSPSAPRKVLISLFGGVLGLVVGFGFVAVRQVFDPRVRTARNLADECGIPCLGSIPISARGRDIPQNVNARQVRFVSAIHDLRTSIEITSSHFRGQGGIVIAVVSCLPGAGVTTICSSLAQLMTKNGSFVTLFQNTARPMNPGPEVIHALPSESLAGAVFADLPPDRISFQENEGLSVLRLYSRDANVNLFTDFRHPRVRKMLDSMRMKGDVILDLPPLQESVDALALTAFADVTIFVARASKTKIEDVTDSLRLLSQAGANVIGAVLNGSR